MGSPSDEELDNLKSRVPFDSKIFDQFKGYKKIPLDKNLKDKIENQVIFNSKIYYIIISFFIKI